jgi:hypothetical protein
MTWIISRFFVISVSIVSPKALATSGRSTNFKIKKIQCVLPACYIYVVVGLKKNSDCFLV